MEILKESDYLDDIICEHIKTDITGRTVCVWGGRYRLDSCG